MKTLITAALLLTATAASAQERPSFARYNMVYAATAGMDLASTVQCLNLGCRERNPIINWLEPHGDVVMLGAGVALEATTALLVERFIGPRHPRLVKTAILAVSAIHGGLAVHNWVNTSQQRASNARR